jgi:chemotaxis protein MotA
VQDLFPKYQFKGDGIMIPQVILSCLLSGGIFFLAFHLEVGEMGLASNLYALIVVLGGTLSATLIAYPWQKLAWTAQLLKKTFQSRNEIDWILDTIVSLARIYRQKGIRALEQEGEELPEGFLKTAVELTAFHHTRDKIEQILQKEAQLIYAQYETAYKILYNMARLAPALGLTGTIVTLIRIFGHMTDPKSLVGYMAIALLSTFYGVVLANLCFIPLSNKLKEFMDYEEICLDLIQEGVLDLYDEENPRVIQHKLEALSTTITRPNRNGVSSRLFLITPKKRASVMS